VGKETFLLNKGGRECLYLSLKPFKMWTAEGGLTAEAVDYRIIGILLTYIFVPACILTP
jgi:hypothetical protein